MSERRPGPFGAALLAAALWIAGCGRAAEPGPAADAGHEPTPEAAPVPSPVEAAQPQGPLRIGKPREAHLSPGKDHTYTIDLQAGDAIFVEVEQSRVDVEAAIVDPRGRPTLRVDTPVGRAAPERICFVAPQAGAFTLLVAPFDQASDDYRVQLRYQRPATEADHTCAKALRLFLAADGRRFQDGAGLDLIPQFMQAQELWRQTGQPFLAALALREAGSTWAELNRGNEGVDLFRQALPLAREAGSTYLEIDLLNRLAMALLGDGDIGPSEALLNEALGLAWRSGDRHLAADVLHGLGEAQRAAGEPHRAIDFYQQALAIRQDLGLEIDRARSLQRLGDAYALLDHHQEALGFLDEALAVFSRHGDRRAQASALLSLGWVHVLSDDAGRAVPVLRQALELQRQLGNRNSQVALLDRLGTALLETGDYPGALAAYTQALALSEQEGSTKDAANTATNVGCLYQRWGKTAQAAAQLAAARDLLQAIDDPLALSQAEYCLAGVERQRGDLAAALGHVEAALAIVDRLRGAARRRGARHRPIWLWQDYAELHVELLMARYLTTGERRFAVRAFEASDLARARNLFELVLESLVGVRSTAAPELLERERRIRDRLNSIEAERRELRAEEAASSETVQAEVAPIERRLGEISLDLERARAAIRRADPRYAELAEPRPVRLAKLQALLDPETVLLSYALGEERSYLYAVGASSFESWSLEPRAHLNAQAEALYRALRQSRFRGFQVPLTAAALAQKLLPREAIPASARRLLVVADGMLHYVPLAILPSPGGDPRNAEDRLLLDDFEIEYLPSASVLAALRRRDAGRPPAPKTVAVFADAVFSGDDPRLTGEAEAVRAPHPRTRQPLASAARTRSVSVERLPEGPLPRLPFTHDEALAILALVPESESAAHLEFAANKQAVLGNPLDPYRLVHFATHALIDERFPELSGLVLSRLDAAGDGIDGNLHLHEIYSLRLAADLVVLSGCQTALGQQVRGDGLLSLTRGFLYAGSSQVLVSLWSVDDEATAHLMAELYRGLIDRRQSPAAALRSAQRWIRQQERWRAPYYWAAFMLQGAGS